MRAAVGRYMSGTDTAGPSSDSSVIRSSATAPGGIEQQSSAGKTVSRSGFSARYVFLSSIRSWYDYTFASNEGIFSYQFKT